MKLRQWLVKLTEIVRQLVATEDTALLFQAMNGTIMYIYALNTKSSMKKHIIVLCEELDLLKI